MVNLASHFPKSFLPHASYDSFMMMSMDDISPQKGRFSKETRFDYIQQLKRHIRGLKKFIADHPVKVGKDA